MSDAQAEAEKLGSDRSSEDSGSQSQQPAIFDRPTGWRKLYYHPILQVALLGFVCFMCPGMFNAINGLGGGGLLTTTVSANANSAVYATFAFFGFFSGTINNRLGPRLTLTLGTWGYSLYIASYLCDFLVVTVNSVSLSCRLGS
jgi:hypothetical protein